AHRRRTGALAVLRDDHGHAHGRGRAGREPRAHRLAPGRLMAGTRISGWGSALPEKVVTNADLEATLDTSDEWIVERTGIRERRIGGTTAGLAIEAGQRALDQAGVAPEDIDFLLLATTTPDQSMPSTASEVQDALGVPAAAA